MKAKTLLFAASAVLLAGPLHAQQQPVYFQEVRCIKVMPGKATEFRQFLGDVTKKIYQARVQAGEIAVWTLLRNVMPAGDEARCDYLNSVIYEGSPKPPLSHQELGAVLTKTGVAMTADEYVDKRSFLSRLVSAELWLMRQRIGHPEKGHYAFVNYMKVHNPPEYTKFENDVWRPMAEQWVKEGSQSGWIYSTAVLPAGTDLKYSALTADVYPNWDAAFKTRSLAETFAKVHPNRNPQETMDAFGKLRDLARRELMVIEERVSK